ncbi:hypothetical protein BDW02DRAFT_146588 [Decorospora gaudefroyi]|uniref:Uncharacterized protein n=1 Tax=Decorospora gaudefroyi TaxID=184978 RepID=A0A6A5K486_9PLEO|nr:hypothetical protein BDW02DRAFT_146588 [Decorospora gaudefroyi]
MADAESSMDSSRIPILEPAHSPPSAGTLSRQDTASSAGSHQYLPMPPGHWLLDFHGSCPRCHHQHNAVKIKVDVSHDTRKVCRIRCEGCRQNWFAFGGRNSTRISLLSTVTTDVDLVEKEVRSALISMAKSATAIASPILSDIPETSSHDRFQEHHGPSSADGGLRPAPGPSVLTPKRVSFHIPATIAGQESRPDSSTTQTTRARLPMLRSSSIKRWFGFSKKPSMSAKAMGKRPVQTPGPPIDSLLDSDTEGALPVRETNVSSQADVLNDLSGKSKEAIDFITGLKDDPLHTMDEKALTTWMRNKLTEFKSRSSHSFAANSITQTTRAELSEVPYPPPARRSSLDGLDLGSHLGYFDRWWEWPNAHIRRPQSINISDRTSEALTMVNDGGAYPSGIRNSLHEFVHHRERRGSGSPRPPSVHRPRRSWQQSHPEARFSLDTTVWGGQMAGPSMTRGGPSNRWSRASLVGVNGMMSRTSLPMPVNEAEDGNGNTPSPPLPPPPSVRDD